MYLSDEFKDEFLKEASLAKGLLAGAGALGLIGGTGALLGHIAGRPDADDVENQVGVVFTPGQEQMARDLLEREKEKSFFLKNPRLGGALTMGIGPSFAAADASGRVARGVLRMNPDLQVKQKIVEDDLHKKRVELLAQEIADREARAKETMVATGANALLQGAAMLADSRREEKTAGVNVIGLRKFAEKIENSENEKGEHLDSKNAPMMQEMGQLGLAKAKAEKYKGVAGESKDKSNVLAEETKQSLEKEATGLAKVAKKDDSTWWDRQKAVVRAGTDREGKRKGNSYIGIANKNLIKERFKGMADHAPKGAAGGGVVGGILGALAGKKGGKGKAGLAGAALGAALGGYGGTVTGTYKGEKKYYGDKGIKLKYLGLDSEFSPEAKKKYLKKQAMGLARAGAKAIKSPQLKVNEVMKATPRSKRDDVLRELRKSKK
jgi:hypothetical protein